MLLGKTAGELLLEGINEEYKTVREYSLEERCRYAEGLVDAYLELEGESPPSTVLNRLGDLILHDYVEGDTRSNKAQVVEYPILSEGQYLRRTRGKNQPRSTTGYSYVESPTDDFSKLNISKEHIELGFLEDIDITLD